MKKFWTVTYKSEEFFFVQGGIFVVIALYTTDDGEQSFIAKEGTNIYQILSALWNQFCEEGLITKAGDTFQT